MILLEPTIVERCRGSVKGGGDGTRTRYLDGLELVEMELGVEDVAAPREEVVGAARPLPQAGVGVFQAAAAAAARPGSGRRHHQHLLFLVERLAFSKPSSFLPRAGRNKLLGIVFFGHNSNGI